MGAYDYPDTLGYITGGLRANFNGVQAALAVNPRTVRTGRTFHALLLAQNNTGAAVELNAALSLPGSILRRQTARFEASSSQQVRLRPGETGYLLMPVTCQPDAATGDNYRLGVSINARPLTQPFPVRPDSGGRPPDLTAMPEKRRNALDKLRQLEYSTSKRFGREELVAPFRVIQGVKSGTEPLPGGGWFSLWSLAEDGTSWMLLALYGDLLKEDVFPRLHKSRMFEPLRRTTEARFKAAGYALKPLEAVFIAKLLTLIVHMANPGEDSFDYLGSQAFNVAALFNHDQPEGEVRLPRWFEGLLRAIAHNEEVAANPAAFVCARLYDTLVREALPFAFEMIRTVTGEDVGNDDEIRAYTDNFLRLLGTTGGLDFAHVYMPLVMGGIIVYDRVIAPDEQLEDTLRDMGEVLAMRDAEWSDDNDLVFLMTKEVVNRSLRLFGFQI